MNKILLVMCALLTSLVLRAQNDFDVLLKAGVDDARQFASDYLEPGTKGLMYSLNHGWYNSAEVKPLLGFEISLIANGALVKDSQRKFWMDEADYRNVQFTSGPSRQEVASVLGENDPGVDVLVRYDDPVFGGRTTEVTLPDGLGDAAVLIPSAVIQAGLGIFKGTELKARFVPEFRYNEVSTQLYGFGIQHEFTKWLPADKLLPFAVSALVAYTRLNGSYEFTRSSGIEGEDQRVRNQTAIWSYQVIGSTRLPVINFYGSIGYLKGSSDSDILGTYRVRDGLLLSEELVDPFSVAHTAEGVSATLGTKLKLGFFRLNADYTFAEYDTFSLGMHFGFR